ncbi:MAG: cob(I)yrinic acid a,c-diamide adenosyltransferase [Candidatus Peribacteraceae bacterium]|jgi:cob(I)alamin adenosyltransferase
MSITTRSGDHGETGLLGGERVSKSSPRLEAYGTIDELNAVLGVVLAEENVPEEISAHLHEVQRLLFRMGTDLATSLDRQVKIERMDQKDVDQIEVWITDLEQALSLLKRFILPSGSRLGALLHQARTVCRRAERRVVALAELEQINTHVQVYLNRLSDYLFLAAREANRRAGAQEVEV